MSKRADHLLGAVARYYTEKIRAHGATPKGVDWNDEASQHLRFDQLARLFDGFGAGAVSVFDLGCGYGEFLRYLRARRPELTQLVFEGVDLSEDMIAAAKDIWRDDAAVRFTLGNLPKARADFGFASGIFNVRLGMNPDLWRNHILETLMIMDRHTIRGFAFNCLSSYSDDGHKVDKLYYADPVVLFDYCKRYFSRNLALLHDYDLYEFTILVRK